MTTPVPVDPPESLEAQGGEYATLAELAMIRLEWAEVLDKITAWANRQAARDRVTMRGLLKEPARAPDELDAEVEARSAASNGVHNPPTGAPEVEGGIPRDKLQRYQNRTRR